MQKTTKYQKISEKIQSWFLGFWVKRRRFTFMLIALIIFGWIFSMINIPKESSPDIEFWVISISTIYQWATPQDIDSLITEKIENNIKDIDWIKKITASSSSSISSLIVELENDANTDKVKTDIEDEISKTSLPQNAEDPEVQDISVNNEMMFSIILYWDSKKYSPFYIKEKWRTLKENLEWKWGINRIDYDSAMDMWLWNINSQSSSFYEIQVLLDKNKVEELWLNSQIISQTVRAWNSNQPIWTHVVWNLWYDFRIQWEITNIEELWDIPIQTIWWSIKLKEISKIERVLKNDSIQKMWRYGLSWQNYITLFFNKQKWDNIFKNAKQAKELLQQEFEKTEYLWLSYITTLDLSEMINDDYDSLARNWIQTLILVFLALLVFIGLKESIIATITLPLAFFITFIVLKNLWLSLNFLTNFSFIITFWIAIDTTIVVIEWAHEKIRQWFKPMNAILLAVREYKTPLISWTATTVFVFIPLLTLPGIMGKFLAYIPITIFSTLVAALFISLTLNSALYFKLSKPKKYFNSNVWDIDYLDQETKFILQEDIKNKQEITENKKNTRMKILDKLWDWYIDKLWKIINNPKKKIFSILIPIRALILSFITISPFLGFELFPWNDNWYLSLSIQWPENIKKEEMLKYNEKLEKILSQQKELKVYYSTLNSNIINTNIELISEKKRKKEGLKSSIEMESFLNKELEVLQSYWLKTNVKAEQDWPPSTSPIWIKIITKNTNKLEELNNIAKDFETFLYSTPWTKNITSSSKQTPWQFVYTFDKTKLTLLGLTPNNFLFEIFGTANGIDAGTIKWEYDNHDIKIYYKQTKENINPQTLGEVSIQTNNWKVNFWSVSDYSFQKWISSINRENGEILITIWADSQEWFKSDSIQSKLENFAKNYDYPKDITYSMWWESQENMELINAIIIAFTVAIISIFAILVLQFNSYTQPVIILYSIIVWLLWANIWLFITWQSYGLMFGIWFIALTWIIVNDAIVLLDRINNNIKKWMDKLSAIKEAWKARLQPIILTTLTTFLWLISIVWDAMRKPLAITIMVGIISWSAVTLFVIPNIYYDKEKLKHIFRRIILKNIIYLIFPIMISVIILFILMMLNISTQWLFTKILIATFVGFSLWYSFYTIYSLSEFWQTIIQRYLWIRILDKNGEKISEKKATKRFLVSIAYLILPALIAIFVWLIVSIFSKTLWNNIWIILAIWLYLFIITKNIISIWTSEENISLTDKFCNTITIDKFIKED